MPQECVCVWGGGYSDIFIYIRRLGPFLGVQNLEIQYFWWNNHNAKFEYKSMKAAGVTDYTNQTPQPFRMEKCPSSTENIFQMCTK